MECINKKVKTEDNLTPGCSFGCAEKHGCKINIVSTQEHARQVKTS